MQHLDVCGKNSGKVWHRKPTPSTDNGGRVVRFMHAAFDSTGEHFLAGDHQGNVFSLVQKCGTPCTALAFCLRKKSEFLVGLSDYSLKCYDTDTREMVAWMKGHESAIHSISVHTSGRYALTTSADTAQLWDLDTFQRKRKLTIKEDVGIVQVFFLPLSNTIITGFRDDTIFAWESDSLTCKFQLPTPPGKSPQYRTFAATKDGRILAAGGRSRFVHLFALDTRKLLRIVEMPEKVTAVKQLIFLPENFDGGASQVLGVLCQDGILRFINIHSCKLLFDLGEIGNKVNNATVSPNGRYITTVNEDGTMSDNTVTSDKSVSSRGSRKQRPSSAPARGKENKARKTEEDTGERELPEGLNMERLQAILKGYYEYPTKYRMFIWRSILRLPENHSAYAALVDKGTHPAFEKLGNEYPIKSTRLLRILQRILSALANWSPIFGETQYLPVLAFPFVKLFQNNHLVAFEIIATIMVNWAQHWFEYFPNPPINILGMIENVIGHHDRYLLQHFVKYNVTSQIYAWPLLETFFSEVLTREEWMMLFDNVFSNPPSFLLMVVAAYAMCARGPLMQCVELDDFRYFFHHRNAVDLKHVLREAYRIMDATPDNIHPRNTLDNFQPLTRGQYPVFNKYPKFIVDYQVQERERIRVEEMDYLRQRQVSMDMQRETGRRQQEEEAWYRQQKLLLEAEDKRRKLIHDEEQKLTDQRKRLNALNREVKLKELQLLDAARRKFLHFQKSQREAELKRLDDEVQRKALLRDQETEQAIEEAEIRNMELQLKKKMFEQELFKEYAMSSHHLRTDQDMHRKQAELEDRIQQRLKDAEREREMEARKKNIDVWAGNEVDNRHSLEDLKREVTSVQLARVHADNRSLEQEVHNLMRKCQDKRLQEHDDGEYERDKQRELASEAHARRLDFMTDEAERGQQHGRDLTEDAIDSTYRSRLGQSYLDGTTRSELLKSFESLSTADTDAMANSISLETKRRGFDEREISLLNEVRRMRQKLATEGRERRPPRLVNCDA
ncbi:TBC31-like protein [Mya arenaria]|uniref:TBC1 domain family member 31 n=1 Tax=Mya arenaria TaxID=6604 RepID=A0ABY7ERC4_MYAAR|nr:TBC31-like protein [Mya arenaria]